MEGQRENVKSRLKKIVLRFSTVRMMTFWMHKMVKKLLQDPKLKLKFLKMRKETLIKEQIVLVRELT
jgi:hypothetical protein